MSNIKQQISEMRKSMPRHIQWLLLAVAFVVVLILLTLLLGRDKKNTTENIVPETKKIEFMFTPPMASLTNVQVGETMEETINILPSSEIRIYSAKLTTEIPGLTINAEACKNQGNIDSTTEGCEIIVKYTPDAATESTETNINIEYNIPGGQPQLNMHNSDFKLLVSAVEPEPVKVPEPVEPEPVEPEPVEPEEPVEIEPVETEPVIPEPVKVIAPADPFKPVEPVKKVRKKKNNPCSDFAMPGYDLSGNQIGWIKPMGGAYYFHPFSDKECKNATGIYNPDNGIISDINNSAKKIGTDAESIGYTVITDGVLPQLSNPPSTRNSQTSANTVTFNYTADQLPGGNDSDFNGRPKGFNAKNPDEPEGKYTGSAGDEDFVVSSLPYDRQFILRQYKPIPATIVSEIRADPETLKNNTLPVRATVDRNVYSDNGRNVIIPAGTLLMGYVTGKLPGPYAAIGRMEIKWYQFILPNGVEFNFPGDGEKDPFSADAQGRTGVPGRGSTDYMEQFFMPMLTAMIPAAVNLIAPVSDAFVNQIDLDNNTVVQSGTVRSSEMAKNEIITAWNQVAQKLMVDMMDNSVPPFSIAAGTRINVYSPVDLIVTCGAPETPAGKKCAIAKYGENKRRSNVQHKYEVDYTDETWVGQARSFSMDDFCEYSSGKWTIKKDALEGYGNGNGNGKEDKLLPYDYRTILAYCESLNYVAINNARQDALYANQQQQFQQTYGDDLQKTGGVAGLGTVYSTESVGTPGAKYNTEVLGLKYDDSGAIKNPFEEPAQPEQDEVVEEIVTCADGSAPDVNGCCPGEEILLPGNPLPTDPNTITDQPLCCVAGGECYDPIVVQ